MIRWHPSPCRCLPAPERWQIPYIDASLTYNKRTLRYYDEYLSVPRLVDAGYVVILQDVRGRFTSDGRFYPFIHEARDGYESVEWASSSPMPVGRWNSSACLITGTASTLSPSLKRSLRS
ncbi:MAG: hypothetical protein M0Z65_09905 [Firmicutes bacterium]|nr:hypothetical protein [Bacillota bacterium]